MTAKYYHGYLQDHNGNGYVLTGFAGKVDYSRVFVKRGRGLSMWVGDDRIDPMVVLVSADGGWSGTLYAGATLGEGMLSTLYLDPVSEIVGDEGVFDRRAWQEAWDAARCEADYWAGQLAEQAETLEDCCDAD